MKDKKFAQGNRPFQFALADLLHPFPLVCKPECPRADCPAEKKIASGCPLFPQFGKRAYRNQHSILNALRTTPAIQ